MADVGEEMHDIMRKLFPICRSITGAGVRQTLKIISEHVPLKIHEVPSGTAVFDWVIPPEWNISDAYIKNSLGEKLVDFKVCNLHVLNYSKPIKKKMSLQELQGHLFTLPKYPEWIPYLTSYYGDNWGFCLKHKDYLQLKEDTYEVVIDSTLEPGSLTYGELFLPGEKQDEVLLTCYVCHPSMCNDNLSGIVLLVFLAKLLSSQKRKYSYRFLFIPETIGAITWLAKNEGSLSKIKHGLVATCVGGPEAFTYKKSRDENAAINSIVKKALEDLGQPYTIRDFFPTGSDERQFCSPGFNLPVGSLLKTIYGFPEYHTSADNLDFVKPEHLDASFKAYAEVINILENDFAYVSLNQKCEPHLRKRNLYRNIGGLKDDKVNDLALLWIISMGDGNCSLLDVSLRSGFKFRDVQKAAEILLGCSLIKAK